MNMNQIIREPQPDIIINNRSRLAEDYGTPEGKLEFMSRDWEACMTSNDKDTKEYIVDLRDSAWEGTITQLRFDPVDAAFDIRGNVYIDSIEFLESLDE